MNRHWQNPWTDAVPVPVEELAEALAGGRISINGAASVPYTAELRLAHWRQHGDKLDAYILQNRHFLTIGVRYGDEPSEYLSLYARDRSKAEALLRKYQNHVKPKE